MCSIINCSSSLRIRTCAELDILFLLVSKFHWNWRTNFYLHNYKWTRDLNYSLEVFFHNPYVLPTWCCHSLTVPSSAPEQYTSPSGEYLTQCTGPKWPLYDSTATQEEIRALTMHSSQCTQFTAWCIITFAQLKILSTDYKTWFVGM